MAIPVNVEIFCYTPPSFFTPPPTNSFVLISFENEKQIGNYNQSLGAFRFWKNPTNTHYEEIYDLCDSCSYAIYYYPIRRRPR